MHARYEGWINKILHVSTLLIAHCENNCFEKLSFSLQLAFRFTYKKLINFPLISKYVIEIFLFGHTNISSLMNNDFRTFIEHPFTKEFNPISLLLCGNFKEAIQ